MGLTKIRAQQISDIDYKQAVRVVATSNVILTGGAPALVDGVSLQAGDRVLVNGQNTGSQNGLYRVSILGTGSNGTWVRSSDGNETGEIQPGMVVMVTEGNTYADTPWKLITNGVITVGVTALMFQQFTTGGAGTPGGNNTEIQYNNSGSFGATANLAWTGTELSIGANIIPQANITYDLGNSTNRWNDIWLANSTIYLGNAEISANATSLIFTNPQGAETVFSGTSANIAANNITATGNISCGNLTATGTVTAANIDSVNADVAERYLADAEYPPGTVLEIGGRSEVTSSTTYASSRVVGVVSTAPAMVMNSGAQGSHATTVALLGRTPCRVIGPVRRGDLVTSSNTAGVAAALDPVHYKPGVVIGKALQDHVGSCETTIEILVGKL